MTKAACRKKDVFGQLVPEGWKSTIITEGSKAAGVGVSGDS